MTFMVIDFEIGKGDRKNQIIKIGNSISENFWDNTKKAILPDLKKIENTINRILPDDFKQYYIEIGHGRFPFDFGHSFHSPTEIIENCHAPVYFVTGSMTPGNEWATNEEQKKFYISHGIDNPNPMKFTKEILVLENIDLLDLVQFGSDGSCCYHQLYTGNIKKIGYCLLTDYQTVENINISFSSALKMMFKEYLDNID
jgi:hypothetical protein